MLILGLLLLAASLGVGGYIAATNTDNTSFEAFGQTWSSVMSEYFLIGAALGALAMLGLWMMAAAMRRSRRRASDRRFDEETRSRMRDLEDDNKQLRRDLEHEREMTASAPPRTPVGETYSSPVVQTGERDTLLTRDRDDDGLADRTESSAPAYTGGNTVGDGMTGNRHTDAVSERESAVYPQDHDTDADVATPAFDETANRTRHRSLFGRYRDT
jgi:hypothetical protein